MKHIFYRRQPGHTKHEAQTQTPAFERALALPVLDHALGALLRRPHMVQAAAIMLGVFAVFFPLISLVSPKVGSDGKRATTILASATELPSVAAENVEGGNGTSPASEEQTVIATVAAYNQASITAAVIGDPAPMTAFLARDGAARTAVQQEYVRRKGRGETHDPSLTRWGVLHVQVDGITAQLETQEQWDDVMSVGGQVVSSRRGLLSRNLYTLQRDAHGNWQIITVASTPIIS